MRSLYADMQDLSALLRRYSVEFEGERSLTLRPDAVLKLDPQRQRLMLSVRDVEDAARFFADKSN
jgi:hypothetical protein